MARFFTFCISFFVTIACFGQDVAKPPAPTQQDPILVSLQNKIRTQQSTIDSILILLMKQESVSIVSDIDKSAKLNEDLVKLGKLALRTDQTLFEVLNGKEELEAIRKYFLPRFSANFVTVDKEGKGNIAIATHENLGEHLDNYTIRDESYKIVNVDFLDTEIAGNVFNMAYKTIVEVYKEDILIETQAILTTLTGKRDEHLWKIGNYSSTSIAFEPELK